MPAFLLLCLCCCFRTKISQSCITLFFQEATRILKLSFGETQEFSCIIQIWTFKRKVVICQTVVLLFHSIPNINSMKHYHTYDRLRLPLEPPQRCAFFFCLLSSFFVPFPNLLTLQLKMESILWHMARHVVPSFLSLLWRVLRIL